MDQTTSSCNCIEHYCCGYEAGRRDVLDRAPVTRLTHREVTEIAARDKDVRFEGNYALSIYHRAGVSPFDKTRQWMLGIEILTERCGVRVTRLKFVADPDVQTYDYGLVED